MGFVDFAGWLATQVFDVVGSVAGVQGADGGATVDLQVGKTVFNDVPAKMRSELWLSQLANKGPAGGAPAVGEYYDLLFESLPPDVLSEIDKDTHRTFPGHPRLSTRAGQDAMLNVLRAYAVYDPEIGYTQGMNFLAGLLLTYLPSEADAYAALSLLMRQRGLREMYLPDMALLQCRLWQLSRLLPPRLAAHLEEHAALPVLYAASWLLTCFAADFPLHFAARVMDVLMTGSQVASPMLKVAVGIVQQCEAALLRMDDFEQMVNYLRQEVPCWSKATLHDMLTDALSKPWTPRQLRVLEQINGAETVMEAVARVNNLAQTSTESEAAEAVAAAAAAAAGLERSGSSTGPAAAAAAAAAAATAGGGGSSSPKQLTPRAIARTLSHSFKLNPLPPPPGSRAGPAVWEGWQATSDLQSMASRAVRIDTSFADTVDLEPQLSQALSCYASLAAPAGRPRPPGGPRQVVAAAAAGPAAPPAGAAEAAGHPAAAAEQAAAAAAPAAAAAQLAAVPAARQEQQQQQQQQQRPAGAAGAGEQAGVQAGWPAFGASPLSTGTLPRALSLASPFASAAPSSTLPPAAAMDLQQQALPPPPLLLPPPQDHAATPAAGGAAVLPACRRQEKGTGEQQAQQQEQQQAQQQGSAGAAGSDSGSIRSFGSFQLGMQPSALPLVATPQQQQQQDPDGSSSGGNGGSASPLHVFLQMFNRSSPAAGERGQGGSSTAAAAAGAEDAKSSSSSSSQITEAPSSHGSSLAAVLAQLGFGGPGSSSASTAAGGGGTGGSGSAQPATAEAAAAAELEAAMAAAAAAAAAAAEKRRKLLQSSECEEFGSWKTALGSQDQSVTSGASWHSAAACAQHAQQASLNSASLSLPLSHLSGQASSTASSSSWRQQQQQQQQQTGAGQPGGRLSEAAASVRAASLQEEFLQGFRISGQQQQQQQPPGS